MDPGNVTAGRSLERTWSMERPWVFASRAEVGGPKCQIRILCCRETLWGFVARVMGVLGWNRMHACTFDGVCLAAAIGEREGASIES